MKRKICRALTVACAASVLLSVGALPQQMPKSSTEKIKGQTTVVSTEKLHGTVIQVEGNNLVVKMSTGEVRLFTPPASRKFVVDGNELTVADLKPGTRLSATVTTTNTPVTERTTTVGTGKVWFVSGTTVILTLPNNENRMYKVKDSYKFNVNGQPATVFDLRKGMIVSAEKIVEAPHSEIATDVAVVGQAPPPPKPVRAQVAKVIPPPPPREETPVAAPAPAPAPEPAAAAPAPAPAELPKTGSPLPLIGLLGSASVALSMALRRPRRS